MSRPVKEIVRCVRWFVEIVEGQRYPISDLRNNTGCSGKDFLIGVQGKKRLEGLK